MKTLSTGEIAKLCDVNLRTVIRWIEKGALKGFKLPGRGNNRVKEEDFLAFLQENGMPIPAELQPDTNPLVLIVDDDPAVARGIQRVLRQAGYQTRVANDGFTAGALLMSEKPGLLTLDLSMPGMDGYQVLQLVRNNPQISTTRILVISALNAESLQRALDEGADAVLAKPYDTDQLLGKVAELLELER